MAAAGIPVPGPIAVDVLLDDARTAKTTKELNNALNIANSFCAAFSGYQTNFADSLTPEVRAILLVQQISTTVTVFKAGFSAYLNTELSTIKQPPLELLNKIRAAETSVDETFHTILNSNREIVELITRGMTARPAPAAVPNNKS